MDNSTNAECKMSSSDGGARTAELLEAPLAFADPTYNSSAGPNPNTGYGVLYNAMINPFTVGPMAISSFIWFQVCETCPALSSPPPLFPASYSLPTHSLTPLSTPFYLPFRGSPTTTTMVFTRVPSPP